MQLEAESFKTLALSEQTLAYWLTQASIAIDPINYDQNSAWGLRQKALLEEILRHPQGVNPQALRKITDFTKLFWANRGNHNEMTAQKFLPEFTFEDLQAAAAQAAHNGGFKDKKPGGLESELAALKASLFDASFEPTITAKSPQGNRDILQASANNFYAGVSLADLKGFQEKYPLNSRLVKGPSGKLVEEVYRAGTPDGKIPPGRYAALPEEGQRVSGEGAGRRRSRPGQGDRRPDPLLPDRRSGGLDQVRHRLGAEQRPRGFRQRLHRGLSRRPRGQGHVAELRLASPTRR